MIEPRGIEHDGQVFKLPEQDQGIDFNPSQRAAWSGPPQK